MTGRPGSVATWMLVEGRGHPPPPDADDGTGISVQVSPSDPHGISEIGATSRFSHRRKLRLVEGR